MLGSSWRQVHVDGPEKTFIFHPLFASENFAEDKVAQLSHVQRDWFPTVSIGGGGVVGYSPRRLWDGDFCHFRSLNRIERMSFHVFQVSGGASYRLKLHVQLVGNDMFANECWTAKRHLCSWMVGPGVKLCWKIGSTCWMLRLSYFAPLTRMMLAFWQAMLGQWDPASISSI